jgi:hypothetical protein
MAASGFTPISLYYSTTPTAQPVNTNLVRGELALNIYDGKLYYKDNANVVQLLAAKGGNGVSTFSAGSTGLTPNTPTSGAIVLAGTLGTGYGGTGLTAFVADQIFFAGTTSTVNQSANLTWNGSTLGVTGVLTVSADSSFNSTGALLISRGATGDQPASPVEGMLRYNTDNKQFEGYSEVGAVPGWYSVGGSAIVNDTTTATELYPLFASATSGTAQTVYTSDAKYLYKPSTGELQANEVVASNGFLVNSDSVASDYTVGTGFNAVSVGPVTVASGISVTVSSGQRWVVL